MYRVLHALIGMLTVDSDFTNSELVSTWPWKSGGLTGSRAPIAHGPGALRRRCASTSTAASACQLWAAIRQDSIARSPSRYPFTVTPAAPR